MKSKFFILCEVIFLVRQWGKFAIDHSWEWKGQRTNWGRAGLFFFRGCVESGFFFYFLVTRPHVARQPAGATPSQGGTDASATPAASAEPTAPEIFCGPTQQAAAATAAAGPSADAAESIRHRQDGSFAQMAWNTLEILKLSCFC